MSDDDLPIGWSEVRLGDIAEIRSGVGFPPALQGRRNGAYAFAKVGDLSAAIRSGRDVLSGAANYVDEQDLKPLRAKPMPSGTILFPKIGESIRLNYRVEASSPLVVDNNVMGVVPDTAVVLPRFLLHRLRTVDLYPLAVSTTVPSLRKSDLAELSIELPPLGEQRRIVARVEDLLARSRRAKEALDAIPPLLETLRRSILAAAFRGELTAEWRAKHPDVEPADRLLARIRVERRRKWEEAELTRLRAKGAAPTDDRWKEKYREPEPMNAQALPELPEGWAWSSIDELSAGDSSVCYGVVQPGEDDVSGGVPLVRVCDLPDDGFRVERSDLRTISADIGAEYNRSRLAGGEVLVSVVGSIGRVAIADSGLAGANIARAVARVVLTPKVPSEWLAFALKSSTLQRRLLLESREVARKTLNVGQLAGMPVPVASAEEMRVVCSVLSQRHATVAALSRDAEVSRAQIPRLESSVLARAFRGELVPQDPPDHPTEAMLPPTPAECNEACALELKTKSARVRTRRPRARIGLQHRE
ncbi:MAG: restriction endonuclease subunit S [Deltaproteobacteria bacterium]|nr:restriction endonuclease subunit S [Deltaproteobacteria bacterium]